MPRVLLVLLAAAAAAALVVAMTSGPGGTPLPEPAAAPAEAAAKAVVDPPARTAVPSAWTLRVVDRAGHPAAGVAVTIGEGGTSMRAVSDAVGALGLPRLPGEAAEPITVTDPGFALVGPASISRAFDAAIVVRRRPSIAGRVVFADSGEGVPGVELQVRGDVGPGARARTDAEGRFRVHGDGAPGAHVALEVVDPGPCVGLAVPSGPWWGRGDVEIRLRRAGHIVVHAVAADTGAPLEAFAVRLRPIGSRALDDGDPAARGVAGRALVGGVWPGVNDLQVVPDDPRYAPSEVVAITLRDTQPPEVRLAVAPRRAVEVLVCDRLGRSIDGAAVRWIDPRGHAGGLREALTEARIPLRPRWRHASAPRVVGEATTDGAGRAVIYVDGDARAQKVEVTAPGDDPVTARVDDVAALDGPVEVRVAARSSIRGRLAPPPARAFRAAVELRSGRRAGGSRRAPLGVDGSFRFDGVPTGRYELVLAGAVPGARGEVAFARITWLANLVVAGGRDEQLELDLRAIVPARVGGAVRGIPEHGDARIELWDDAELLRRSALGAEGSFAFEGLGARRAVRLRVGWQVDGRTVLRWDPDGSFDLGWGGAVARDVAIGDATLEVRLVTPGGAPVPVGSSVWVRADGDTATERAGTGADGTARFPNLRAGRHWLTTDVPARVPPRDLGAVDLAPGAVTAVVLSPR